MTPMTTTTVVYDLGGIPSWLAVAAAVGGVVAALLIAGQDRKAARREAHQRWELEQLTRIAALAADSGGVEDKMSGDALAEKRRRQGELMALRWVLGGPQRFPVGLRLEHGKVDDVGAMRQRRDDVTSGDGPWTRGQLEAFVLAVEAAEAYEAGRR